MESLSGLGFSLVGAGRVAESLGRWLAADGARPRCISAATPHRAERLAADLGATPVPLDALSSDGQGLLLLAVPDDALASVVAALAQRPQARVALHTSGAQGSEALAPLRRLGSAVGSLHPLRAFPRALGDPRAMRGIFWAVDGDPAALQLGEGLARRWQGTPGRVDPSVRPLYHLAASLAAGGVVTLLAGALALVEELPLQAARRGYLELARSALDGVAGADAPWESSYQEGAGTASRSAAAAAITGPVRRGDLSYLEQLSALRRLTPALYPLAVLLALETLRQVSLEVPLTEQQQLLHKALLERSAAPGFLDPLRS